MPFDTSPSTVLAYRASVATAIQGAMPASVRVEAHDGYFDETTLERISFAVPTVYVAVLKALPYTGRGSQMQTHYGTGQQLFQLHLVCFIAAAHEGGTNASDIAWAIAEIIANLAVQNAFSDATLPAENVAIENLWSNKSDRRGVAIASVAWNCDIQLGTDFTAQAEALAGYLATDTFGSGLNGGDPTATVVESIDGVANTQPPPMDGQ